MTNQKCSFVLISLSIINTHIQIVLLGAYIKYELLLFPLRSSTHFYILSPIHSSFLIKIPGIPGQQCGYFKGSVIQ